MDAVQIVISFILGWLTLYLTTYYLSRYLYRDAHFNPNGKHCYITGGSQGLGKSLAILLASKGANVTIVARTKSTLEEALAEIKVFISIFPDKKSKINDSQKFCAISVDVSNPSDSIKGIQESVKAIGTPPQYIFCCAGYSRPGYILDLDSSVFENTMKVNYLGTVYTVKESVRLMVENGIKGKIVLTSSVAGLVAFIGYAAYSPTKFAVKAFAESLQTELLPYGITTHCYCAGTLDSPGLAEENKTKPAITKIIEGNDSISTEQAALSLYAGLQNGESVITSDIVGSIVRAGCGINNWSNIVVDSLLFLASLILFPAIRFYVFLLILQEKNKSKKL